MKPVWMNTAMRLQRWLENIRLKAQPYVDGRLATIMKEPIGKVEKDFVADADYFMIQQEPLRARVLVRSLAVVLVLFVMWAAVTQVDEMAKGEGKVVPSQQLQVLQSLDGGIVSEIAVREGDVVKAGQVLLRIDPTRFASSVGESRSQYLSLLAKTARLRALAENKPFIPPEEVIREDAKTADEERRLFESAQTNLEAQLGVARQQLAQRQHELSEAEARHIQARQAYELSNKELVVTRTLLKSGAVSEVELLRLERDVSRFKGERDMASAQILKSQSAISEASRKIQEIELHFRNDQRTELADTQAKLNAIEAGSIGLADKVKHSVIRSPMRGTVKRLLVNTVGGVVQAGKDAVEIVPLEDNLLLEAKVIPRDIAFLRPGQKALVKFTAYDFSIYGGLEATLEQIGADTVTDERGNTFYIVRVRTHKSRLGNDLPIIPGMVAEVDIITGQKSILSYLLKPVIRAKQAAFSER
ncbi:MAG: HlyD family type I secretion periplasmic adaptor subunit [Sulfuricella denitrificans]|nr:HlyD family type I secretion periplasmic adaptor subunit [Sulfuricella denitrificans]